MTEGETSRAGVDRAAILLLALGEQEAAQVLRHLDAEEVQQVGAAMAKLTSVSREEVSGVLSAFSTNVEQQTSFGIGIDEYIRKMMIEALGPDKAGSVIDRILGRSTSRGLESIKWMELKAVVQLLRNEHPQIIAIVLSYLDTAQAAKVLAQLPAEVRSDVLMRIALLDGVHPTALNELDEVLEKKFAGDGSPQTPASFGGPKVAAEILTAVGTDKEVAILAQIAEIDQPLSQKLQDLMFVFGDLLKADDRGMQELLREVPGDKLIIALKGADDTLKQKIFKNMSERAAQMMKDDLEAKGPVRLSEVEAAQKEILVTARRMSDEGKLQLGGKGGEEYV